MFKYFVRLTDSDTFKSRIAHLKSIGVDAKDIDIIPGDGVLCKTQRRLTPTEAAQAGAILHTQAA